MTRSLSIDDSMSRNPRESHQGPSGEISQTRRVDSVPLLRKFLPKILTAPIRVKGVAANHAKAYVRSYNLPHDIERFGLAMHPSE